MSLHQVRSVERALLERVLGRDLDIYLVSQVENGADIALLASVPAVRPRPATARSDGSDGRARRQPARSAPSRQGEESSRRRLKVPEPSRHSVEWLDALRIHLDAVLGGSSRAYVIKHLKIGTSEGRTERELFASVSRRLLARGARPDLTSDEVARLARAAGWLSSQDRKQAHEPGGSRTGIRSERYVRPVAGGLPTLGKPKQWRCVATVDDSPSQRRGTLAAGRWQSGRDADATSRIAARTEPCVADRPRILTAAAPPSRRRQRGRHQRPQRHCRHVTPRQWPEALTIQCWLSELPPEHNVGSASDSERWRLAGYPFEDRPSTVSSSARIRRWPLRLRSPRSGNSTFVPTAHVGGGASRLLARRSQGAGTPAKLARTSEKRPGSRCHPVS